MIMLVFDAIVQVEGIKMYIPFVHSFALGLASVHVVHAPVKKAMVEPTVTFAPTQR